MNSPSKKAFNYDQWLSAYGYSNKVSPLVLDPICRQFMTDSRVADCESLDVWLEISHLVLPLKEAERNALEALWEASRVASKPKDIEPKEAEEVKPSKSKFKRYSPEAVENKK